MLLKSSTRWELGLSAGALFLLSACSSTRLTQPAPVEDRGRPPAAVVAPAPMAASIPVAPTATSKPPPAGIENTGKPGYHTVKPGETLIRISLDHGQNWRDIARWNSLSNPNIIEVGQVLRVVPPGIHTPASSTETVVIARPVPLSAGVSASESTSKSPPASAVSVPPPTSSPSTVTTGPDEDVGWIWPANGQVIGGFDDTKNKGLDITGKAGDPVLAAGDGRVVYAGAGLRGYGNLIILKHNNTYLSAYAHNQTLLVKEDQTVRKGQKVAEMGNSDADRVKLHFEIRRQGKPVDPVRYLPAR